MVALVMSIFMLFVIGFGSVVYDARRMGGELCLRVRQLYFGDAAAQQLVFRLPSSSLS